METFEDVLKMLAHGAFGQAKLPADVGITAPGRDEPEQFPLPRSQLGRSGPASLRIPVDIVQVRPEQSQQHPVALAEVSALPAQEKPERPSREGWQAHDELVLNAEIPEVLGVHRRAMPLPLRIVIRDHPHASEITRALRVTARRAVPIVQPEHWRKPWLAEATMTAAPPVPRIQLKE